MKKLLSVCLAMLVLCTPLFGIAEGYGVQNGDFSAGADSWSLTATKAEVTNEGTLRLFANTMVSQRVDGILAGNTYTLTASYMAESGTTPLIALEWIVPNGQSGYNYLRTDYSWGTASGEWRTMTKTLVAPTYAEAVFLRLRKNDSTSGNVYWDNVALTGTYGETVKETVDPVSGGTAGLKTDCTFYYSDMEGNGIATVNDGLEADTVEFSLWDGETSLMTETVEYGNDFAFPLTTLTQEKHTYLVRAKVYSGQTLLAEGERKIYKFPRSSRIQSDGVYRVDGEPFMPVMMYNITQTANYSKMSEIGVNVVQAQLNDSTLNAAQAQGLKVLAVLYPGMLPAGHPNNVQNTRYLVNKYKNHPALFGWAIMDEPYYILVDREAGPQYDKEVVDGWLENSYKIIREIDDTHPVYLTQDGASRYVDASHYTDILCIDPYVGNRDYNTHVYNYTKLACAAANGKKPVYTLLQTSEFLGTFPTSVQARHMVYQARLAGAEGIGYYCFGGAQGNLNLDATALWDGLKAIKEEDLPLLPILETAETVETDTAVLGKGEDIVVALNKTTGIGAGAIETAYTYSEKVDGDAVASIENGVVNVTLQPSAAAVFRLGNIETETVFVENFADGAETAWTCSSGATIADGILTVSGTSTASYAQKTVTGITPGHYVLHFRHKNEVNGAAGFCPNVVIYAGSYTIDMTGWTSIPTPGTSDWVEYKVYFKVPAAASSIQLKFRGSTKGPYLFDDIEIEKEDKMHFMLLNKAGFGYNGGVYPTSSSIRRHPLTEGDRIYYPVKAKGTLAQAGKPLLATVHVPDAVAGETAKLTAKVYTADDTLLGIYEKEHTFITNDDGFITLDINEATQSGAKVKLFLWTDSISGEAETILIP